MTNGSPHFRFSSFGHSFVIRHSTFNGDISRPDESSDQPFLVLFVLVALLMVLVILDATPEERRLGRGIWRGVTENIFGAQTTNVLVKFTDWLAGIFFAITFGYLSCTPIRAPVATARSGVS